MIIVQKYGGTSVATPEKIRAVAARVQKSVAGGDKIVVIVSAMAGETDRLLTLTHQVAAEPAERESDVVTTTGEQVAAGLLALAVQSLGVKARSLLAFQIPVVTDGIHSRSRIEAIATDRISGLLDQGYVVIIPGFQGVSKEGDLTTLGRGGSDTSAVAIAAALKADVCEICSDVDGVYTTDPNLSPKARKITSLTYDEMLEIAGSGAKVVQMRAVELAAKCNLPLHLRSSFSEKPEGTKVGGEHRPMEEILVSAVTHTLNEAKVSVFDVPDQPARMNPVTEIFEPLARANINVDMIVQNIGSDGKKNISFTVEKHDLKKAIVLAERAAVKIGAGRVEAAGDVAKISIVGIGMRSHAGVAARMFDILSQNEIHIHLISTSEIKVSVVVDMKHTEQAVRVLHTTFGLDKF